MKPNYKKIHIMSAPRADYRKPVTKGVSVLTSLRRHVKTDTLAFVMFLAQALLSATHGKDSETRESASLKATKPEVRLFTKNIDSTGRCNGDLDQPRQRATRRDEANGLFQKSEQGFTNSFVTAGTNSFKEAPVIITPSLTKDR